MVSSRPITSTCQSVPRADHSQPTRCVPSTRDRPGSTAWSVCQAPLRQHRVADPLPTPRGIPRRVPGRTIVRRATRPRRVLLLRTEVVRPARRSQPRIGTTVSRNRIRPDRSRSSPSADETSRQRGWDRSSTPSRFSTAELVIDCWTRLARRRSATAWTPRASWCSRARGVPRRDRRCRSLQSLDASRCLRPGVQKRC